MFFKELSCIHISCVIPDTGNLCPLLINIFMIYVFPPFYFQPVYSAVFDFFFFCTQQPIVG